MNKLLGVVSLYVLVLYAGVAQDFLPAPVPPVVTHDVTFKLNYPLEHLDLNNYAPSTRGLFANTDIHFRFYTRQADWTQSNLFNEVRWDADLDASNGLQWSDWEQDQTPGHYAERVIQFPHGGKYTATVELRWTNTLGQTYSRQKSYELYVAPYPTFVYSDPAGNKLYYWVGDDNVLDKPSLLVEGFDPSNENTPEINYALGFDLIEDAKAAGFDLFIMEWADGGVALESNRDVFLGACRFIHALLDGREAAIQVVGISMGGTIARYGLAWAEDGTSLAHPGSYVEHYVNTFISFDGPQQGAHFNSAFQNLVRDYGNPAQRNILQCTAARQLLYSSTYTSLNAQLQSNMRSLHNDQPEYGETKGYPRRCVNLAISNGNRFTNYPEKTTDDDLATITIHGQLNLWDIQTIPLITQEVHIKAEERDLWPGSTFSYDLSSLYLDGFKYIGRVSWGPIFADAAASWRFRIHFNPGYTPTESALDFDNFARVDDGSIVGGVSRFDETMMQTSFQRHEVLTEESRARVMQWLTANATRPYLGRPSALRAGSLLGSVTFTDNAAFEQGFKVERRVAGGPYTEIMTLPPNTTRFADTDPGRQPYTTYYYRIRSFAGTAVSIPSEEFGMIYRPHLSARQPGAFSGNNQKKLVRLSDGTLAMGYESDETLLRTSSSNEGASWETETIVGGVATEGTRYRNLSLVLDSLAGTATHVYEEVVHDNEGDSWLHRLKWDGAPYVAGIPSGVTRLSTLAELRAEDSFDPMPVAAMTAKSAAVPALLAAAWRTPDDGIMYGVGTSPYVPDGPSAPPRWSTRSLVSYAGASHPALIIVPAGAAQQLAVPKYQLVIAWQEEGESGGIRLMNGLWNGESWPPQADQFAFNGPHIVAANTAVIRNEDPVLGADGAGNLVIAWVMRNEPPLSSSGTIKVQTRLLGNIDQSGGTVALQQPLPARGDPAGPVVKADPGGSNCSVVWSMTGGGVCSAHRRDGVWGASMVLDGAGALAAIEQSLAASVTPGKVAYASWAGPPYGISITSSDPVPGPPAGIALQSQIIGTKRHPKIVWQANTDPDIASYRLYRYTCPHTVCNCGGTPVCIASLPPGTTSYVDQTYVLWQKSSQSIAPQYCVHYFVKAMDGIGQVSGASADLKVYANDNLEAGGEIDGMEKRATGSEPLCFALEANYPNPFNPSTTIRFSVAEKAHVKLVVYDVVGRVVATIVDEMMNADMYERVFDGSGIPSGVYYVRMNAGAFAAVQKLILLK